MDEDYNTGRTLLVRHLAAGRRIIREDIGALGVRWTDAARAAGTYHTVAAERLLERGYFCRDGKRFTLGSAASAVTPTYFAQEDSE